jgi:hypothetical protein
MKKLQRQIALLYATYLGTVPFFTFCLMLILVGVVAACLPKFAWVVLVVSFISQTVIQLLSLPALQILSVEAEAQRQEDHATVMSSHALQVENNARVETLLGGVHALISELHTLHFQDSISDDHE